MNNECIRQNDLEAKNEKQKSDAEDPSPYFSEMMSIDTILDKCDQDQSFIKKAKQIANKYSHLRLVRRDGNCFYRSFIFHVLELAYNNPPIIDQLKQQSKKYKESLITLGYPEVTVSDFYDTFIEFIDCYNLENLTRLLNDTSTCLCDYLVVLFRLFASAHLQLNAEFFQPFIDNDKTLKQFCLEDVEPMGTEADHLQILALTSALNIPVQVVYLDKSPGDDLHIYKTDDQKECNVKLLFRHSHYDVLY